MFYYTGEVTQEKCNRHCKSFQKRPIHVSLKTSSYPNNLCYEMEVATLFRMSLQFLVVTKTYLDCILAQQEEGFQTLKVL